MLELGLTGRLQQAANDLFPRAEARGYDALDERDRTLYCVWLFCGDVDAGGLRAFLGQGPARRPQDTAAALDRIGASDAAAVVRAGVALSPAGIRGDAPSSARPPPDRERALDELGARFDAIGSERILDRLVGWYFR